MSTMIVPIRRAMPEHPSLRLRVASGRTVVRTGRVRASRECVSRQINRKQIGVARIVTAPRRLQDQVAIKVTGSTL